MTEALFNNTELPTSGMPFVQWIQTNTGIVGNVLPGSRQPGLIIATIEYDDGSHLDVLNGAVIAW